MNFIRRLYDRIFPTAQALPAGTYHYQGGADTGFPYRLHLRIEPNGQGLLILNASTVLHLNQTAAEYAYHFVSNTPVDEIVRQVSRRYNVPAQQVMPDYVDFQDRLETLITTPDLDPDLVLEGGREIPFSALSAPLRLDCALTYRVSSPEGKGSTPVERVKRELLTEEWQAILKKAWDAGIPHVVFTGGEPTLRPDLPDLIAYAEQLGQVTGLLTDGLRLADPEYLHQVLQAGLDHLMIVLDPLEDESWEALRDCLAEDVFIAVHLTISEHNHKEMPSLIRRLKEMGVKALSLSAQEQTLKDALDVARQTAAEQRLALVWDLPVPYSPLNPVSLELAEAGESPAGAGRAWLYVEPDGDVLPSQGGPIVLGNLVEQPWESIWKPQ